MDHLSTPFNVSFGVRKEGGGEVTFRVEHTFDNVLASGVSARPFTHADVSAATDNADGNYAFPVMAVRLAVVSASGTNTLDFTVIQAGP